MSDASSAVGTRDVTAYVLCRLEDIPSRKVRGFHLLRMDGAGVGRPWSILVVRWGRRVFGYTNLCPHNDVPLDWERNQFLDPMGTRLMCGKHGALFDLATGQCVEGPCQGLELEPVDLAIMDGDICITGVTLVEDEVDEKDGQDGE